MPEAEFAFLDGIKCFRVPLPDFGLGWILGIGRKIEVLGVQKLVSPNMDSRVFPSEFGA
jgi:hypothetical protein